MENKDILEILKAFSELNIEELELKNKELEIKLSKSKKIDTNYLTELTKTLSNKASSEIIENFAKNENNDQTQTKTERKPNEQIVEGITEKEEDKEGIEVITSPIVGTFYEAPAPGKPPFVKVGDNISKGQVLCIIEAMKVMNKIESEVEGKIIEKLVKNEQPVEFGTPLFKIKII